MPATALASVRWVSVPLLVYLNKRRRACILFCTHVVFIMYVEKSVQKQCGTGFQGCPACPFCLPILPILPCFELPVHGTLVGFGLHPRDAGSIASTHRHSSSVIGLCQRTPQTSTRRPSTYRHARMYLLAETNPRTIKQYVCVCGGGGYS